MEHLTLFEGVIPFGFKLFVFFFALDQIFNYLCQDIS